jgi:hypothetical protein
MGYGANAQCPKCKASNWATNTYCGKCYDYLTVKPAKPPQPHGSWNAKAGKKRSNNAANANGWSGWVNYPKQKWPDSTGTVIANMVALGEKGGLDDTLLDQLKQHQKEHRATTQAALPPAMQAKRIEQKVADIERKLVNNEKSMCETREQKEDIEAREADLVQARKALLDQKSELQEELDEFKKGTKVPEPVEGSITLEMLRDAPSPIQDAWKAFNVLLSVHAAEVAGRQQCPPTPPIKTADEDMHIKSDDEGEANEAKLYTKAEFNQRVAWEVARASQADLISQQWSSLYASNRIAYENERKGDRSRSRGPPPAGEPQEGDKGPPAPAGTPA